MAVCTRLFSRFGLASPQLWLPANMFCLGAPPLPTDPRLNGGSSTFPQYHQAASHHQPAARRLSTCQNVRESCLSAVDTAAIERLADLG